MGGAQYFASLHAALLYRETRCKLSTCYADLVFLLYARLISSHTHFTKTDSLDPIDTSPSCHIKQATFSLSSDDRERSRSALNSSIVACAVLYHHVDHRGQRSKIIALCPYTSVYVSKHALTRFARLGCAAAEECLLKSYSYLLNWSTSF